eukprot:GILI01047350.1.p1 GENE.GILI01047350.1~~GILI01047350.1.p1  ORF type:complete len:166 (+),score=6.82 GILI01047350.1:26-499(+)
MVLGIGKAVRGSIFAYHYVTKPYFRFEAKRNWRRQYREWKIFDRERVLSKIFFPSLLVLGLYLLFNSRLFRIFFRLPSEDPNYLMKTDVFKEEQNALWQRREEAEKRLKDSNIVYDRNHQTFKNGFVGETGHTPLYTSGDGEIPSPASITGVKSGGA